MRRIATLLLLVLAGLAFWRTAVSAPRAATNPNPAIYDSDPNHPWNRLYAALLIRQDKHGNRHGEDALDPLLWRETEHLLAEPSHKIAIQALDDFLQSHAESAVHDPAKKAMLQRDLWSVFDWTVQQDSAYQHPQYEKEKQELQSRLAQVLKRLALTPEEIKALPDNYAQAVASGAFGKEYDPANRERPFLPVDLFDPRGPWVCLTPSPELEAGVAPMHLFSVSGRSGFLVFVRLPEGRKATYDYLQTLWNSPEPYVGGADFAADQALINPALPSFPAGTQVALVRRLTVFDTQGVLTPSAVTESVQIRFYRHITTAEERNFGNGNIRDIIRNSGQDFFEFKLSRPLLFAGTNGGLRAIAGDEKGFVTFQTKGDDPFEESSGPRAMASTITEMQTCVWCHNGGGIQSLNSRDALLKPRRRQQEPRSVEYGPIYWSDGTSLAWKENRFDWGLLNGYWRTIR